MDILYSSTSAKVLHSSIESFAGLSCSEFIKDMVRLPIL
jgi:hypothetical protein